VRLLSFSPLAFSPLIVVLATTATLAQDPDASVPPPDRQEAVTDVSFQWAPALTQSLLGFTIANAERYAREAGTREATQGPFFKNYLHDIQNFHGWQDGDGVESTYVAHPMEGAFAAYIERQNDPRYKTVEFGHSQRYWESIMRSLAFSAAYSTAWSFGPAGEPGLGNVETYAPPGVVDLVGTPVMGIGWMIGEDMLDRFLVKRIENRYQNVVIRALARSMLNPARSYANLVRFKVPWMRDTRSIYGPRDIGYKPHDDITGPQFDSRTWPANAAFELNGQAMIEQFTGKGAQTCVGAAGEGVLKLTARSALVFRIDGCQLLGFQADHFGDTLNYMAGPRWRVSSTGGRWKSYVQLTGGGAKVTHTYVNEPLKATLTRIAIQKGQEPPDDTAWSTEVDTNGFTLVASGQVAWQINHGMELRVADLSYQHSWLSELQGMNYDNGLRYTFGISFRLGDWDRRTVSELAGGR
jgi:hypothetical protein